MLDLLRQRGCSDVAVLHRRVSDGTLHAIRSCQPPDHLWHLSLSYERGWRRRARVPSWIEVMDARRELLPDNIVVVLRLPNDFADSTMHLYELREERSERTELEPGVRSERPAVQGAVRGLYESG